MKQLILIMSLALSINAYSQDDKTVTLVASGQGKTQDEAKQNALRSAIEQAFGTFISSKTEILNDNLVKDEIVSVSNGNIQKFEIISEVQIPNGDYATSLKATVSVTKLTSFVQSKGVVVEFKGSLFAFNVNQQILNEKNEIKAIKDLCKVITKLSDASFEYSIKASDPVAINASNEKWRIPLYISVSANNNLLSIATYINQTLKGLSLSIDEANNYIKLGKKVYPISIAANEEEYNHVLLRTEKAVTNLIAQLYYFNHSIQNFKISNGLSEWKIIDYPGNLKYISDYGFRIFWLDYLDTKCGVYYAPVYQGLGSDEFNLEISSSEGPSYAVRECPEWFRSSEKALDEEIHGSYYKDKLAGLETNNSKTLFLIYGDTSDPEFFFENIKESFDRDRAYIPNDQHFKDQFAFLNKLKKIGDSGFGIMFSFIGIKPQNEIVRFYYEDIKTLEEINKISEYKVSPIVN